MDYTMEYAQTKQLERDTLYQINFAQLKKELVFPFELAIFEGCDRILCY